MPITTTWLSSRGPLGVGHSASASRATSSWLTISWARRLRTSGIVPVWQNEQVRLQPTWVERHSVPRAASGM